LPLPPAPAGEKMTVTVVPPLSMQSAKSLH
jgi:hypothetical protein